MPVRFSCVETVALPPAEIASRILDVDQWPQFQGYGILPGIAQARFEKRTPEVVGSLIGVTNTDGSSHVEEIIHWEPDRKLVLHLQDFSPPLARIATRFEETWQFNRAEGTTHVVRSFVLRARSPLMLPLLWLISIILKRAIARQLKAIAGDV